ncbi:MAG: EthD family reductase, partial [Chloroflexi bacterium]|nr:EthD family reductase [Chloroflexota bacterium]
GHPTNPSAFDQYYASTHVPLAKKIPGLRSFTTSTGSTASREGRAAYYLVAELDFDSVADLQKAFGTPEGEAAGADLANFATGGATTLWYEVRNA